MRPLTIDQSARDVVTLVGPSRRRARTPPSELGRRDRLREPERHRCVRLQRPPAPTWRYPIPHAGSRAGRERRPEVVAAAIADVGAVERLMDVRDEMNDELERLQPIARRR